MPRPELLLPRRSVGREVHKAPRQLLAEDSPLLGELSQRVLHPDVEHVLEFVRGVTGIRLVDQDLAGSQQRPVLREPDRAERPEAELVEPGNLVEGVVLPPMGIAGTRGELVELSEDGGVHRGAQRSLELVQRGDLVLSEQAGQVVGVKGLGSHCRSFAPPVA